MTALSLKNTVNFTMHVRGLPLFKFIMTFSMNYKQVIKHNTHDTVLSLDY